MNSSPFYRHVVALTAMTPLDYQKHLRLNQARTRFLTGDHAVADVGFAVGCFSPSQFSRASTLMINVP